MTESVGSHRAQLEAAAEDGRKRGLDVAFRIGFRQNEAGTMVSVLHIVMVKRGGAPPGPAVWRFIRLSEPPHDQDTPQQRLDQ